jgi:hypothetical protein
MNAVNAAASPGNNQQSQSQDQTKSQASPNVGQALHQKASKQKAEISDDDL